MVTLCHCNRIWTEQLKRRKVNFASLFQRISVHLGRESMLSFTVVGLCCGESSYHGRVERREGIRTWSFYTLQSTTSTEMILSSRLFLLKAIRAPSSTPAGE